MTKNLNWFFLEIFLGGLSEFWKFALQFEIVAELNADHQHIWAYISVMHI